MRTVFAVLRRRAVDVRRIALRRCGEGGTARRTAAAPSFTIVVNPSAPVLAPGTTAALQVSLLTQGGFDSAVSVAITGLPTGISAQPASLSLSPGGAAQPVQLSAQATVAPGTYGAQFQGTAGGATGTTPITINVGTLESFALVPPRPIRSWRKWESVRRCRSKQLCAVLRAWAPTS